MIQEIRWCETHNVRIDDDWHGMTYATCRGATIKRGQTYPDPAECSIIDAYVVPKDEVEIMNRGPKGGFPNEQVGIFSLPQEDE